MLEQKIKSKTTIDESLQKAIDQETNKWRHFLSALDMISKLDPELRAHTESLHKGNISYFTPYIQNEHVGILASEVKNKF